MRSGTREGLASALLLVAASGLARETAEAARRAGWDVLGCLDDDVAKHGTEVMPGLRVLGGIDTVGRFPEASVAICAGKGAAREAIATRLAALGIDDERYAVVLDPSVVAPPSCAVGVGSILLAGVTLTASVTVGRHVVCMPGVVLTHDDVVEDFATLCAGVVLGGSVVVGQRAYLGMASSVRERTQVGPDSVLAMGAVAIRDLTMGQMAVGVPAAPMVQDVEGVP
ncbi:MAG: acetyltransferase [Dermatophilaceae bacterium]